MLDTKLRDAYGVFHEIHRGGVAMTALRILTVLFMIVSFIITVVILLQEGKQAGLTGAISGAAESYWGKNKGRSMEGKLEKITKICVVLFFVLSIVLNMDFINY